jgi:hypothetical protein
MSWADGARGLPAILRAMITLGLRAQKGGAVFVILSMEAEGPKLRQAGVVSTSAEGDRLSLEPYRLASQVARSAAPDIVSRGRERQAALAVANLQALVDQHRPARAALLVHRAGWITDLLAYSLASPEHVPVAELLAVRDALRLAAGRCGLALLEQDEKALGERMSSGEFDAVLRDLGRAAGRPWRREQKLASLAAWMAAT